MLTYDIWTEEDIKNRGIAEEGIYRFKVLSVTKEKTKPGFDKNGNEKPIRDMLVLEFLFTDKDGSEKSVKDWIVFMKGMDWKLRHLAISINQLELYESKQLDLPNIQSKCGSFSIGIKTYRDDNNIEKKSNFVKDYIQAPLPPATMPLSNLNEDVPF